MLKELLEISKTADLTQKVQYVPVRVSDLFQGFQSAVNKANKAVRTQSEGNRDIESMSIKDLEITLSAQIIDEGHGQDPILMLPNIKSVTENTSKVTLKFKVVSSPEK